MMRTFLDAGDEPVATPTEGFDNRLPASIVSNRFARRHDTVVERGIADELIGPQIVEKLLPADDAVAPVAITPLMNVRRECFCSSTPVDSA